MNSLRACSRSYTSCKISSLLFPRNNDVPIVRIRVFRIRKMPIWYGYRVCCGVSTRLQVKFMCYLKICATCREGPTIQARIALEHLMMNLCFVCENRTQASNKVKRAPFMLLILDVMTAVFIKKVICGNGSSARRWTPRGEQSMEASLPGSGATVH